MFFAAQENLSFADRGRREDLFPDLVSRDPDELRPGLHDGHHAVVVQEIDMPIRGNERSVMFAQSLLPKNSSARRIKAMRHAGVRDHKKVIAFDNRRWDVGGT